MKIALVHYWLVGMRGGEKVLEEICNIYPEADIFTHVASPEKLSDVINRHKIRETFIAKLPGAAKHYQKYLPLMPRALEALDLTDYDLVISFESGPAKGVIVRPDALHICYVHSPMRYIWDQYHVYRRQAGGIAKIMMSVIANKLRIWDVTSAARVDHFVANSTFVSNRIQKYWRRSSTVVFPPVEVDAFEQVQRGPNDNFFLYAGELTSYKRPDLAVEAFNKTGKQLIVIGEGSERAALEAIAKPNIKFLGRVDFDSLRDHYARCRALIFPGIEDFGIIPLEVMASGRPVIALAQGGALDTVLHEKTGILYHDNSTAGLIAALEKFDTLEPSFTPRALIEHAKMFSASRFHEEMTAFINDKLTPR